MRRSMSNNAKPLETTPPTKLLDQVRDRLSAAALIGSLRWIFIRRLSGGCKAFLASVSGRSAPAIPLRPGKRETSPVKIPLVAPIFSCRPGYSQSTFRSFDLVFLRPCRRSYSPVSTAGNDNTYIAMARRSLSVSGAVLLSITSAMMSPA